MSAKSDAISSFVRAIRSTAVSAIGRRGRSVGNTDAGNEMEGINHRLREACRYGTLQLTNYFASAGFRTARGNVPYAGARAGVGGGGEDGG